MKDILSDLNWRYAVKKFDSERILTENQIDKLKEVFNLTATSYGLQPIRLVTIQNKALQQKLVAHSFDQLQVVQASHVLVFCVENTVDASYISNYFKLVKKTRGTPDEILNPFKEMMTESFSNMNSTEIKAWSKNQAYLAMGALLTVCAMEKIDACPMEGFNAQKYDEILELKKQNLKAVLLLPVGFRAEDDFMSTLKKVRKPIDQTILNY